MRKKFTMLFAALLACAGAWAVDLATVADGVYTISGDENGTRGNLAACADYADYPVLSNVTYSGCEGNSSAAMTDGEYWYVTTKSGLSFVYNVSLGKFLANVGGNINFSDSPYAWSIVVNGDYTSLYDSSNGKYLSFACGTAPASRNVRWDTNANDGGAKHTFTVVENGTATYAEKITTANAAIAPEVLPYEYAASNQAFFLKNVSTGLYMTVVTAESTNYDAGGVQIEAKAESTSLSQVFFLVEDGGKFKIKSGEGYYLTAFSTWGYKATSTDSDGAKHTIALSDNKYTLKSTFGFVGSNNEATTAGAVMYSNHDAEKTNIYWAFETLTESEVVALQLPAVKTSLDEAVAAANTAITAHAALTEEQKTAITTAISTAQGAYDAIDAANATYADVENVNKAISDINAAVSAAIYVSSLEALSNNVCYTVATESRGAWYSEDAQLNSTEKLSVTYNLIDTNQQFAFLKSENNNYYLYSVGKAKFVSVSGSYTTLTDDPVQAISFLKGTRSTNYPWVIALGGEKQIGVSNNYNPGVITFWNDLSDGGNTVRLEVAVSFEPTAALAKIATYETRGVKIQALEEAIAEAQAKVDGMGDGLGYYSSNNANAATELATIKEFYAGITTETTVEAIEEQTAAAEAITASFSVNLPEEGKYYRIKNDDGTGYLSGNAATSGRVQFVANIGEEASSIFYFENGKLLSYATGLYLAKGSSEDFVHYTTTVGADAGIDFTFKGSSETGKLLILFNADGRSFYSNGVGASNAGSATQDAQYYRFTIEEVTTLPVTISSVGYATFYAPVEVTLPEGVTAHTVTANGDYATLSEAISVVPAENGVILAGAEGTYNLTISNTAAADLENALAGTIAKTLVTKTEGDAYYVLAVKNENVGLYNPVNGETATEFYNAGHKAYWHIAAATQSAGYRFGEGTTAIDNAQLTNDNEVVIYDLAGRRVQKMEKGIYIVNGKKVIR